MHHSVVIFFTVLLFVFESVFGKQDLPKAIYEIYVVNKPEMADNSNYVNLVLEWLKSNDMKAKGVEVVDVFDEIEEDFRLIIANLGPSHKEIVIELKNSSVGKYVESIDLDPLHQNKEDDESEAETPYYNEGNAEDLLHRAEL